MSTKIKIGGLMREIDAEYVNQAQPDYAGVVLCKRFYRGVTLDEAKKIRRRLSDNIPLVGVFVNDQYMDVLVALRQGVIDIAQLHGTESEEYITHLQMMCGKPIIKACQVHSREVLQYASRTAAEHVLLSGEPDSGKAFDWSLLRNFYRPYFLSGGLTPDNLSHAIKTVHPWGVSLSVGVETDGIKDERKIMAAVEAARGCV